MLKDEQIKTYIRESEESGSGEDKKKCQKVKERIEEVERKKEKKGGKRDRNKKTLQEQWQVENKCKRKVEQR